MKIYLHITESPLNGYLNLSPAPQDLHDKPCNIKDLDPYIDDGEAYEILAPNILDFIPTNQMMSTLKNWVNKLRHGGKIIVGGTELLEVCRQVINQNINTVTANEILHGKGQHAWDFKQGQLSVMDIVDIFKEFGLIIKKRRLDGINFIVEAERP